MLPPEIPGRNGDRRDAHHRQARRTAGKGDSICFSTTAKSSIILAIVLSLCGHFAMHLSRLFQVCLRITPTHTPEP